MEIDKRRVGQRIKDIRQSKGMTMEEFGKIFNASKGNVSLWEKGSSLPSNERLPKIAEIEGGTVETLLYGTPEQYINTVIYSDNAKNFVNENVLNHVVDYYKKNDLSPYNDDENIINRYDNFLSRQDKNSHPVNITNEEIYSQIFLLENVKTEIRQMIFDYELPNNSKSGNAIYFIDNTIQLLQQLDDDFKLNEEARQKRYHPPYPYNDTTDQD